MRSEQRAPLWLGTLFIIVGIFFLLVAVNVIPFDPNSLHAPNWVLVAAALIFILGGIAALIPHENTLLQTLFGALLFTLFGVIGSWVAFGPGTRSFSGSISIGPISLGGISPESIGRAIFGCGAVITDLAALFMWFRLIRDFVRAK